MLTRSQAVLVNNFFTPLNIINRTPKGRPVQCSRATLPENQLYQAPIKDGRPDSNVHRCKGVEEDVCRKTMILRDGTKVGSVAKKSARKPENVFTVVRTRSQSKLTIDTSDDFISKPMTPSVPTGSSRAPKYPVNIDFDGSSREWRRNKRSLGNGTYKYIFQ